LELVLPRGLPRAIGNFALAKFPQSSAPKVLRDGFLACLRWRAPPVYPLSSSLDLSPVSSLFRSDPPCPSLRRTPTLSPCNRHFMNFPPPILILKNRQIGSYEFIVSKIQKLKLKAECIFIERQTEEALVQSRQGSCALVKLGVRNYVHVHDFCHQQQPHGCDRPHDRLSQLLYPSVHHQAQKDQTPSHAPSHNTHEVK